MGGTGDGVEVRDKSIRISFTFEGVRHRPRLMVGDRPMRPTQANLKHARDLVRKIRSRIEDGTFVYAEFFPSTAASAAGTVGAQLDTWLLTQRIEDSTKDGYSSAVRFWKAAPVGEVKFGDIALRTLRTSQIKVAIASRPSLSGKTINNYVSVLRGALALAVDDRLLPDNPADRIERADHQKEPPDPFEPAERDRIIAHATARHPAQVANLIAFWFWTGLRTSELFGLQWANVDLAARTVTVREALVRGRQKARTKTSTIRVVRLNSNALAALQAQREHTQLAGGAVFLDPRYGEPWNEERAFRRSYWTPTLKLLGIRYRRPYNCRHTYATAMLMAGVTPAFAARQLGHSIEMFLRTYARWLDGEQNDREMARIEATIAVPELSHGGAQGSQVVDSKGK